MTGLLDGVRVLEVSMYGFVPAAGAVLADWGASVTKVEHPKGGDPMRHLTIGGISPGEGGVTYMWEVFNRGKRSLAVDLSKPDGLAVILDLVAESDIFLTSLRPSARDKLGIDAESVMARNPSIVYARGSGQGPRGPEADKGGFDAISYWFRSGAGAAVTPAGSARPLNMPGPAFGDIQSGALLAGGIGTALGQSQRTGVGVVVDLSLMAAGFWAMQPGIVGTQVTGEATLMSQPGAGNPMSFNYPTSDGRSIAFSFVEPDRYWDDFCQTVGRPDWIGHERVGTAALRQEHFDECVGLIEDVTRTKPLDEWVQIFSGLEGQWDVVQRVGDLHRDRQAIENGYLVDVEYPTRNLSLVAAPVQFDEQTPVMTPAPGHGEHTADVLAELGRSDNEIARLSAEGIVRTTST
jgi:crotonobetainyl-CoA:carnitine CoA-transferase CaiB-like acyl-CoA transferase